MKMGAISQGIYTIQTLVEYIQVFNRLFFPDTFGKEKIPGHSDITVSINNKLPRYLRELYWHFVRVKTM